MSDDDVTMPETPEAKRLSFPHLGGGQEQSIEERWRELANAVMSIASNLQYLRDADASRAHQEGVNATALRHHDARLVDIEARLRKLEGKP